MKRNFGYFLIFLTAVGILLGCSRHARVIPASKLKKIYSEMLLVDQWIALDWTQTRVADTSLVYSQILEKYGYTAKDYRKSVSHYMEDPDRFAKLFEEINKDFADRVKAIDEEIKAKSRIDSLKRVLLGRNFRRPEIFSGLCELPYYDSILFALDSTGRYSARPIEPDTSYRGPEILFKDAADTTATADSTADSTSSALRFIADDTLNLKAAVKNFRHNGERVLAPDGNGIRRKIKNRR